MRLGGDSSCGLLESACSLRLCKQGLCSCSFWETSLVRCLFGLGAFFCNVSCNVVL